MPTTLEQDLNDRLIKEVNHPTPSPTTIKILLREGASPNASSGYMETALVLAIQRNGNLSVIQSLIDAGADVNRGNFDGWTPLMFAAQMGQVNTMNILIAAKADPDKQTRHKSTALMIATINGQVDAARTLLDAGARTDIRDDQGRTASDIAALLGEPKFLELISTAPAQQPTSNRRPMPPTEGFAPA